MAHNIENPSVNLSPWHGIRFVCANTLFGKQQTVKRGRVPVPTATSRRSPSRAELVAERIPVDTWTQAKRHAELSRLYVNLGIAEAIAERFGENENQ